MAFFQQLRLLLWKNGLGGIRHPIWSLTLIIWPLVIFLIVAVTRHQFPPIVTETCYVGTRNLPSTGFFPFLQTLLCNTDSRCHNKSRLWDSSSSANQRSSSSGKRSSQALADLIEGRTALPLDFAQDLGFDPKELLTFLENIMGSSEAGTLYSASHMNSTYMGDQGNLSSLLTSVTFLKKAVCTTLLPFINMTFNPNPVSHSMVVFCQSNNTALEVTLNILNQVLTNLMMTNPDEMVTAAGATMMLIEHLQNETTLWEALLTLPQLFHNGSVDQALDNTEILLRNIRGAAHFIQTNFPETAQTLSAGYPLLADSLNVVRYFVHWPGKNESVALEDIITVENSTIAQMFFSVLPDVQIPLHKAIGLMLDRNIVLSHFCRNSSDMLVSVACGTGTLDTLLSWISPDKLAKQILLVWSKRVASHDVAFFKGMVHTLIGSFTEGHGDSTMGRRRREADVEPLNIEEDLFLSIGHVVMELVEMVPQVDTVFQNILSTVFSTMKTGNQAIIIIEDIMGKAARDYSRFEQMFATLMTNQSAASMWADRLVDSVVEAVEEVSNFGNSSCEEVLRPFEWLLATESISADTWRNLACQYGYNIEQAILDYLMPLISEGQGWVQTFQGQVEVNVTLPMILSEWHKFNSSMQSVASIFTALGGGANGMLVNNTDHLTGTALHSVYMLLRRTADVIEGSWYWPSAKPYFHALYWILTYRPSAMYNPANCSADYFTWEVQCETGLNWDTLVQIIVQPPTQDSVVDVVKGTAIFLQNVYGNLYLSRALTSLNELNIGGEAVSGYIYSLLSQLNTYVTLVAVQPGSITSDPDYFPQLIGGLLTGLHLGPIGELIFSDTPVNFSMVLDAAAKLGRQSQQSINFDETDPTLPELERSIARFLAMEGNLTFAIPHIMGYSLLTYSNYFDPESVDKFRSLIRPFTSKTSSGFIEAILSAVELLKNVTDSPNGDPTEMIKIYITQLQELIMSMYRLRQINQVPLPSGQLSAEQVIDLHHFSKEFFSLLTPQYLQYLSRAGPEKAQNITIQRFVALLPSEVQEDAVRFFHHFLALQNKMTNVPPGFAISTKFSEIFSFIDQIMEMMLSANGTLFMNVATPNSLVQAEEYEDLSTTVFSLILNRRDAAAVDTSRKILHLIRSLLDKQNISVSDVNNALREAHLTLEELNDFAVLVGVANIKDLLDNSMAIANHYQCFEPQHNETVPAQCVQTLLYHFTGFLLAIPDHPYNVSILPLAQQIINTTFTEVMQTNYSSQPNIVVSQTLNRTLEKLKLTFHELDLDTPEIREYTKLLERVIQLMASTDPLMYLNNVTMQDPNSVQMAYLQMVQWYLSKLENITSNSSFSELSQPIFYMTQMQVALQLSQTNFSSLVSHQIELLIQGLNYPVDSEGMKDIAQTVIVILRGLLDTVMLNIKTQGSEHMMNVTVINGLESQIRQYLNLLENWIENPNVTLTLLDMHPWGNGPYDRILMDVMHLVQGSLQFVFHPNMSYASSLNTTLLILSRTESLIYQISPQEVAPYLIPVVKLVATYFETITVSGGPETMNRLILNEMRTLLSVLPENSTAQAYLSVAINITQSILNSGQVYLHPLNFESATLEDVPRFIGQMSKVLGMILMEIPEIPHSVLLSLNLIGKFSALMSEVLTGQDEQYMWHRLEEVLGALLSSIEGTELLHNITSAVPLFERTVGNLAISMEAARMMTRGLELAVVSLMNDLLPAVNSTNIDGSVVVEGIQPAIQWTMLAVQQSNGSLECSQVLPIWEPVREAVGLSNETMSAWCNVELTPVAVNYTALLNVQPFPPDLDVEPTTVNATVARIIITLRSLNHAALSQTQGTENLIKTVSEGLFLITGQPVRPEVQHHWFKELQSAQLQQSLTSISMLSAHLVNEAPFLHPYIIPVEEVLVHMVMNIHPFKGSTSEEFFKQTVMIFLTSANMTSYDMMSMMLGDFSKVNESSITDMLTQIVTEWTDQQVFGDSPMVYQAMEKILMSNETTQLIKKVLDLTTWLTSTPASVDMLMQAFPKMYDVLRSFLAMLNKVIPEMPPDSELFEDLAGNIIEMLRQLVSTADFLPPMGHHYGMYQPEGTYSNYTVRTRRRRDAPMMPPSSPIDDIIDLFSIDYPALFHALSVPPSAAEILETFHVLFANPDLNVVLKGSTSSMPWGLNASREETIDAALGVFSFLTLPGALGSRSSMELLVNAVEKIPDDLPFAALLKNITKALANETQENLHFIMETLNTVFEIFQLSPTNEEFKEKLEFLRRQVCVLESMEHMQQLLQFFNIEPGQLCTTVIPSLQGLVDLLMTNPSTLSEAMFQTFIGNPETYKVQGNWSSVLTRNMGLNFTGLHSLNINVTSPGVLTVGMLLKNQAAFVMDVQHNMEFDEGALDLLMNTTLPNNNLEILSWFVSLHQCNPAAFTSDMKATDAAIFEAFCSLSPQDWYIFMVLMSKHVDMKKLVYRLVLSDEVQSLIAAMLQVLKMITDMMGQIIPAIDQLQSYLLSVDDLNLGASNEFNLMARGARSSMSSQATFVTLSRALCSKGILALFGISKLTTVSHTDPSVHSQQKREEMIERFKIPRNATPYCMNMYLDMVNTTGGAIAWAFLKPMLMGHILYTPDTPVTRDIMKKSNATLHDFANLKKNSQEWLESSNYIVNSAEILGQTLPMLQRSLSNSFVKNFIQMQTDIDVDKMKDTLSNFSNMTEMLEQNKHLLKQITTLSNMMVDLSSCIKFDRYRGYKSAEELNDAAQILARNRNLYASVIFKLPQDEENSSKKRHARSPSDSSSTSALPPKVQYTIRMHLDNVMRTDRVRNPYFVKDPHIFKGQTLRYNRGFIYLQENIDRAIIETHAGEKVTDPAVQLQPFPYPCHQRDEYLEAMGFVFPFMLMLAWILFVADFVKRLVHERELRLHEYMKMMGVNPISHFFAWFLECAAYLVLTIIVLTLVMTYGKILPNSNGFLLFLYFCDYGLSVIAFSYLISSFFDKTAIAGLSGSLIYILCFFPFVIVMAMETTFSFSLKNFLSLSSPTCFSLASQYITRYEAQGDGIQWSNSYTSPIADDKSSFGWLCWLMLIDSMLYFVIGAYVRMVFPGKYGIPAPWYFPFKMSFWTDLCCKSKSGKTKGLFFTNIMQKNQPVFDNDKEKGQNTFSFQASEEFSEVPVGVVVRGLSKVYGDRAAIHDLNVSFHEGHVTSLLGHNGAGKTTTMSLLTGLFAPTSGYIDVYGKDMQNNIDDIRREMGVCMQYDVLFDHMTSKEHLLLYGQIKAPHWSRGVLHEQVRTILEETGMYAHRHKRVGTLSGGMKRKLSISIAFIGGSRLVVLDEPTTGVDPCSRRSIWDIVIQHKKDRTIIMSTHHLDEAEVLSDCIAFLEKGGLKCCGSPVYLKDKLGQGYKITLTKKMKNPESVKVDSADIKEFIQAHVPEARLKEAQGYDLVYSLPPFNSSNASSYRSLLTALDSNLDDLQLGGYGISDTTLEEVFLQLTQEHLDSDTVPLSISETISDTGSLDSFSSDQSDGCGDMIKLHNSSSLSGIGLLWQQVVAILIKRFHHSRRNWKGLISQLLLPVVFVVFAMGLGSIKSDMWHYPAMELSPALYNIGPSYSFFSNQNPSSSRLVDTMLSYPGIDNACLDKLDAMGVCAETRSGWTSSGNISEDFKVCQCTEKEQICYNNYKPPHQTIPSSQTVFNLTGFNVEKYLVSTANDFIRNRYGGFEFGMKLPPDLQMDLLPVPRNKTLSKIWFNPEGHHTMPAYINSLSNLILRSNLPDDKDPREYAISVSSHPYFGRGDDEELIVDGMLQILVAMCVLIGYSVTTASFAIYEVHEHHSGAKMLQHIAGVSEPLYWIVNFVYDMVIYMIPVSFTICVIAAFQLSAFNERQNFGAVVLLFVLFGFATFPWMYLLSSVFKNAETAFITYVGINLFISINTIMSTTILHFLSRISMQDPEIIKELFERLCHGFLIFPQFNFGNGLLHLARSNLEYQMLKEYGVDVYQNPFSGAGIGWMLLASFIEGVVFFTLRLLLNDYLIRKVRRLICARKNVQHISNKDMDEDVAAEHMRVSSGAAGSDILQVHQLTKIYQHLRKKIHAVKSLSVGIPAGECFGLLGVNGAGKTTTFKMLTGDVSPSDGTAQIRDWTGQMVDIMECRNKGINIGYCPQEDALDSMLTGEEHLYFYARIRGISKREIHGVVNYLLKRLELNYHRDIITDSYSCGTRRKLSTALSLIGHPQILLLDEPSSGMDPRTKRHLWKIISEEVKGKCAVVLTSHSMEECEALCSRLAIMVKGQFRCLGSLQHIKNRFGSGFTVKMYLAEASCDAKAITGFMQRRFPSTYLKDHHSTMLEYHVPMAPGGVADIFDQLESNKAALQIKHFSVSQTTLDEVFINFAMGKDSMDSKPVKEDLDDFDDIDTADT